MGAAAHAERGALSADIGWGVALINVRAPYAQGSPSQVGSSGTLSGRTQQFGLLARGRFVHGFTRRFVAGTDGAPARNTAGRALRDQRAGPSTTPMVAIMPLSSCSRIWQWNTKRPSFGPSNLIITNTRVRGGSG